MCIGHHWAGLAYYPWCPATSSVKDAAHVCQLAPKFTQSWIAWRVNLIQLAKKLEIPKSESFHFFGNVHCHHGNFICQKCSLPSWNMVHSTHHFFIIFQHFSEHPPTRHGLFHGPHSLLGGPCPGAHQRRHRRLGGQLRLLYRDPVAHRTTGGAHCGATDAVGGRTLGLRPSGWCSGCRTSAVKYGWNICDELWCSWWRILKWVFRVRIRQDPAGSRRISSWLCSWRQWVQWARVAFTSWNNLKQSKGFQAY